jgi:hypothetical protein
MPDSTGEDPTSLEGQLHQLVAEGKLEEAARIAIQRQVSKGFAITFLRGNVVVKQFPDGREEILATLVDRASAVHATEEK